MTKLHGKHGRYLGCGCISATRLAHSFLRINWENPVGEQANSHHPVPKTHNSCGIAWVPRATYWFGFSTLCLRGAHIAFVRQRPVQPTYCVTRHQDSTGVGRAEFIMTICILILLLMRYD